MKINSLMLSLLTIAGMMCSGCNDVGNYTTSNGLLTMFPKGAASSETFVNEVSAFYRTILDGKASYKISRNDRTGFEDYDHYEIQLESNNDVADFYDAVSKITDDGHLLIDKMPKDIWYFATSVYASLKNENKFISFLVYRFNNLAEGTWTMRADTGGEITMTITDTRTNDKANQWNCPATITINAHEGSAIVDKYIYSVAMEATIVDKKYILTGTSSEGNFLSFEIEASPDRITGKINRFTTGSAAFIVNGAKMTKIE